PAGAGRPGQVALEVARAVRRAPVGAPFRTLVHGLFASLCQQPRWLGAGQVDQPQLLLRGRERACDYQPASVGRERAGPITGIDFENTADLAAVQVLHVDVEPAL